MSWCQWKECSALSALLLEATSRVGKSADGSLPSASYTVLGPGLASSVLCFGLEYCIATISSFTSLVPAAVFTTGVLVFCTHHPYKAPDGH